MPFEKASSCICKILFESYKRSQVAFSNIIDYPLPISAEDEACNPLRHSNCDNNIKFNCPWNVLPEEE